MRPSIIISLAFIALVASQTITPNSGTTGSVLEVSWPGHTPRWWSLSGSVVVRNETSIVSTTAVSYPNNTVFYNSFPTPSYVIEIPYDLPQTSTYNLKTDAGFMQPSNPTFTIVLYDDANVASSPITWTMNLDMSYYPYTNLVTFGISTITIFSTVTTASGTSVVPYMPNGQDYCLFEQVNGTEVLYSPIGKDGGCLVDFNRDHAPAAYYVTVVQPRSNSADLRLFRLLYRPDPKTKEPLEYVPIQQLRTPTTVEIAAPIGAFCGMVVLSLAAFFFSMYKSEKADIQEAANLLGHHHSSRNLLH